MHRPEISLHTQCKFMEINNLAKRGKRRRDGVFKSQAVARLHMGLIDSNALCRALKISRTLLRQWLRWDYRRRVFQWINQSEMKASNKLESLKKQVAELEKQLEAERIRSEAYEILLDIGKEKYGVDLRKKTGAKR